MDPRTRFLPLLAGPLLAGPLLAGPLLAGVAGTHLGDQLAVAALPLVAMLALGGEPWLVGLLLAAQASAWLLLSLPAGLVVDRYGRPAVLRGAALASAVGHAAAALGAASGSAFVIGAGAFVASGGTALFVLAAGSVVPDVAPRGRLASANARLELARATVTLAAPPLAGALASAGRPELAFAIAAAATLLAALCLLRLEVPAAPQPGERPGPVAAVREGVAFILGEALLRGIALCALFWNMGFFALLAAFAPFALSLARLDPAGIGLAQAGYGAGLLLGATLAPAAITRLGPNVVLVGGPLLSVAAPALLLSARPGAACTHAFAAQFLVGFGPMMWLVCQQSIRQAVTPGGLLGRVGAALQVAIYGVRPLGALAGGAVVAGSGPAAGVALAALLFAASLAAALLSPLGRLRRLPLPAATP